MYLRDIVSNEERNYSYSSFTQTDIQYKFEHPDTTTVLASVLFQSFESLKFYRLRYRKRLSHSSTEFQGNLCLLLLSPFRIFSATQNDTNSNQRYIQFEVENHLNVRHYALDLRARKLELKPITSESILHSLTSFRSKILRRGFLHHQT